MKWMAIIFLGVLGLGGVLRFIVAFLKRSDLLTGADRMLDRRRLIALGFVNMIGSIVGFVFLLEQGFPPLDVFFGTAIVSILCEVAFRKGSIDWSGNSKAG
jgi:MFS family permease